MPDFGLEEAAGGLVAGVDEAGRGPLAGPVVAAAVVLDRDRLPAKLARGLDDSKKLSAARRADLFSALHDLARAGRAWIGTGVADVVEIDALNILQATMLGMVRAVDGLGVVPDCVLVDGNRAPALPCPVQCVVRGDARSLSIAAASIIAKVTRDTIMTDLAGSFPGYGWERNAGYGTTEHRAALARHGPTPHHRRSFAPIRQYLAAHPAKSSIS